MSNKIFCTAPFTTLRIEKYASQIPGKGEWGVIYKPGCVYHPNAPIPSLDEYLNGADMTAHRENLCNGTVPRKNCIDCSEPERLGLSSVRQQLLKKPWASDQKTIKLLDINFSNTCNLGCLMCNASFSSYINNERFNAGIQPELLENINNIQVGLDTIDKLPDLVSVSFIGGEFFLVKENQFILDKIIQRNIGATIMTNATVINPILLDKLKQIKNLEIRISMDGTESTLEFIRYPAKWETLVANFKLLKENLPWAEFYINTIIQPLNIQNLHELYEWANLNRIAVHHQILTGPEYLSWSILTDNEKHQLKELLNTKQTANFKLSTKQKQLFDEVSSGLDRAVFSSSLRNTGIDFLAKICKHRKLSAATIKTQFGILNDLSNELLLKIDQL